MTEVFYEIRLTEEQLAACAAYVSRRHRRARIRLTAAWLAAVLTLLNGLGLF